MSAGTATSGAGSARSRCCGPGKIILIHQMRVNRCQTVSLPLHGGVGEKRHSDELINVGLNALDKVGAPTRWLRSSPTPLT